MNYVHRTARTQQGQTTEHKITSAKQKAKAHAPSPGLQKQTAEYRATPEMQEHATMNTLLAQTNKYESMEQTTLYGSPYQEQISQHTSEEYNYYDMMTTEHQRQPAVGVSIQHVLRCLHSGHFLTLESDEVWLNVHYTGNTTGPPYLRAPSTCNLQVRGQSFGIMSLLIFNVTCFSDNELVVHSRLKTRNSYDCDPTEWIAPGVELLLTTDWAAVSLQIRDVHSAFRLFARFKIVPENKSKKLEIRKVSPNLGTSIAAVFASLFSSYLYLAMSSHSRT